MGEYIPTWRIKMEKQEIVKTLWESWNGVAINGTLYTQWMATEEFFQLWKVKKEEIKAMKYSLYKHDNRGWVVTLFGATEGKFASYEAYTESQEKMKFNKYYSRIIDWIEFGFGLSARERTQLTREVEKMTTIDELYDFVQREADNPDSVWNEI